MAVSKERQLLEREVTSALLSSGYVKAKGGKFLKRIGQETDVFVYPGIGSKSSILTLQPIVGIENLTLRSRLESIEAENTDGRVGYLYMGQVPGVSEQWGGFGLWQPKGQPTTPMVEMFMTAMEKIVCPRLAVYDSVNQVIDLLERYIASLDDRDLVVADAPEKLAILRSN